MFIPDLIRAKARKLAGSPKTSQLSDADLNQYIDDFYLYDYPNLVRVDWLHTTFTIYTIPNVQIYQLNQNLLINWEQPVFLDGNPMVVTQDRLQWNQWSNPQYITETVSTSVGGSSLTFTLGNLPILRQSVGVSAKRGNGNLMSLQDTFAGGNLDTSPLFALGADGSLPNNGRIDYNTGEVTALFPNSIPAGQPITATYASYTPGRPTAILFARTPVNTYVNSGNYEENNRGYNLEFWPVPDKPYRVDLTVWRRPASITTRNNYLVNSFEDDTWQLIAIGAARKIAQDRMDLDTYAALTPMLDEQIGLVTNRIAVQQSQFRTQTLYTGMQNQSGAFGWNNGLQ